MSLSAHEHSLFALDAYLRPQVQEGDESDELHVPLGATILLSTNNLAGFQATAYEVGSAVTATIRL